MSISITLTFPECMISRIDKDRGDINRSKFILRLIEKAYGKSDWSVLKVD